MRWRTPRNNIALTFGLATHFNDQMQMDLMFYYNIPEFRVGGIRGILAMHLVDRCTKCSATAALNNKDLNRSLEVISRHWVSISGAMDTFIIDGGEQV